MINTRSRLRSSPVWRRRLIFIGVTALVGIVVGVVFSRVAGVAVFLAVVTVRLLMLAPNELDMSEAAGREMGRKLLGSDADERKH